MSHLGGGSGVEDETDVRPLQRDRAHQFTGHVPGARAEAPVDRAALAKRIPTSGRGEVLDLIQDPARRGAQRLAGGRQAHLSGRAVEQPDPELALELGDLLTDI
jgi:hypothetical protein